MVFCRHRGPWSYLYLGHVKKCNVMMACNQRNAQIHMKTNNKKQSRHFALLVFKTMLTCDFTVSHWLPCVDGDYTYSYNVCSHSILKNYYALSTCMCISLIYTIKNLQCKNFESVTVVEFSMTLSWNAKFFAAFSRSWNNKHKCMKHIHIQWIQNLQNTFTGNCSRRGWCKTETVWYSCLLFTLFNVNNQSFIS